MSAPVPAPTLALRRQALEVARSWRGALDLDGLIAPHVADLTGVVDLVAIGKAAPEMCHSTSRLLGERVRRQFVVGDGASTTDPGVVTLVGEHPMPGRGSEEAGLRLLSFLEGSDGADVTVFLISGGASSLCVVPSPPVTLEDLRAVFHEAVALGWDITRLNHLRAATSLLGGGAVLRRVRSSRSRSLIMVDNAVAGAPWVASAMTFEFAPTPGEVAGLVGELRDVEPESRARLVAGIRGRSRLMTERPTVEHENRTAVDPGAVANAVARSAASLGWRPVPTGVVDGGVEEVVARWSESLASAPDGNACFIGVGEVTVRVEGGGLGGRCQEFALRLADPLSRLGRPGVAVAVATDGRDFVEGVGGAWSDDATTRRLAERGVDVAEHLARHDAYRALAADGALLEGAHTGWNLCDLYLVALGPRSR